MLIHCLSLERATERRDRIRSDWIDGGGFDVRFVDAFDRRRVGVDTLPFAYDDAKTRARLGRSMSAGEIACATSHAVLVRGALDAGLEELVVLEDDVRPLPGTTPETVAAAIDACRGAFPHVSVLLMHDQLGRVRIADNRGSTRLAAPVPFGYNGFCFVWLSRRAMAILADDLAGMSFPADHYWRQRFAPMKNLALPAEPLARHDDDTTYIGHEERGPSSRRYVP
jgi:hypothetical protein